MGVRLATGCRTDTELTLPGSRDYSHAMAGHTMLSTLIAGQKGAANHDADPSVPRTSSRDAASQRHARMDVLRRAPYDPTYETSTIVTTVAQC